MQLFHVVLELSWETAVKLYWDGDSLLGKKIRESNVYLHTPKFMPTTTSGSLCKTLQSQNLY